MKYNVLLSCSIKCFGHRMPIKTWTDHSWISECRFASKAAEGRHMRLESHLKKVNAEHLSKQSEWQSVEENKQMTRKEEHYQTCTQRFSYMPETLPVLFESSCII